MGPLNPRDILNTLIEGNARFATGRLIERNISIAHRYNLLKKQRPKAVVLTCADSRVAPEIIFDATLGDLFVIRNAGNLADTLVIESIGYGISHLNINLVIVLGHTHCGAVTEAVKIPTISPEHGQIANRLKPAIANAHKYDDDIINGTVIANIYRTIGTLSTSPDLLAPIKTNQIYVRGALYRLEDGLVQLLE